MREISIKIPNWLNTICNKNILSKSFNSDEEKMRFAINLAKTNINKGGGPFGAAIFKGNALISCGVNLVLQNKLSILHAEVVAILIAQAKLHTYNLSISRELELFSSSEPCIMCFGAILWSGIKRVVFGAPTSVAKEIGFDEGPIDSEMWEYLKKRGVSVTGNLLKAEAIRVLHEYKTRNGEIYSP